MPANESDLGIYNLLQPIKLAGLLRAAIKNESEAKDKVSPWVLIKLAGNASLKQTQENLNQALDNYNSPEMPTIEQMQAMLDALNGLLDEYSLYNSLVFTDLPLNLQKEADNRPLQGDDLRKFNRALLEYGYYKAADDTQIIGNIPRRLRFFDGQFLRPADLQEEQDYHRYQLRIHNRALHTPGIAEGLEAIPVGKDAIKVAAGVALDSDGNELIFLGNPKLPVKTGDDVFLVFTEAQAEGEGFQAIGQKTRWQRNTELKAYPHDDKTSRNGVLICTIGEVKGDKLTITMAPQVGVKEQTREVGALTFKTKANDPNKYPYFQVPDNNDAVVVLYRGGLAIDNGNLTIKGEKDVRISVGNSTQIWSWASGWNKAGDFSLIEEGIVGNRIYFQKGTDHVGIGISNPQSALHIGSKSGISIGGVNDKGEKADGYTALSISLSAEKDGYAKLQAVKSSGAKPTPGDLILNPTGGNVGIGTDSPTQLLTLFGGDLNLRTRDNANPQSLLFQNSGGKYTWRIYRRDAGSHLADLRFAGGFTDDPTQLPDLMTLTNNGKVGIGTSNPQSALHIGSKSGISIGGVNDKGEKADGYTALSISLSAEKDGYAKLQAVKSSGAKPTPGDLILNPTGGNVGIGDFTGASPEALLHVKGDLKIGGNELLFADNGQIRSLDNNHRILFRRSDNKMELREHGDLIFSPGSGGTETAKVVMLASGNVGIGTTNPGDKLTILGGALSFQHPTNPVPHVGMDYDAKGDALRLRANEGSAALNTDLVTIKRVGGYVGIGTPDPKAQLHVKGDLQIDGGLKFLNGVSPLGVASDKPYQVVLGMCGTFIDGHAPPNGPGHTGSCSFSPLDGCTGDITIVFTKKFAGTPIGFATVNLGGGSVSITQLGDDGAKMTYKGGNTAAWVHYLFIGAPQS